jgi:uncharacterized protein (TIGR02246 family)
MAEDNVASRLIRSYVEGWKAADSRRILDTLQPDCVVVESHGTTYRGREQVERWIESWLAEGNTVDRWDITSLLALNDACAFEWVFSCTVARTRHSFEGASFARLNAGRIAFLREYRMTEPHHEWAG